MAGALPWPQVWSGTGRSMGPGNWAIGLRLEPGNKKAPVTLWWQELFCCAEPGSTALQWACLLGLFWQVADRIYGLTTVADFKVQTW